MKTIIALAALAVALAAASPSFAATKRAGASQPKINGYTLQEWQAGAPSGDPENGQ